jgi:hypothetical protein
MKDLIEEIYYLLEEGVMIKGNSPKIICHAENVLLKRLKGKDKKLFGDYEVAYSEYCALTAVESFKQGFKVGFDFAEELGQL